MPLQKRSALCTANFIVISFIPIAFFVSMILGYVGVISLNVPIHSLGVIGFILFIFLLFIPHNANYSICNMRSTYEHLNANLRTELKETSLIIEQESKSVLDINKYISTYYTNVRNGNFVSVASSIFPMLGILGTFVAIALSMPDFSVSDSEALDHEISLLLSGVGSAFFASIYGILLSLIWTYFEKRGLSKIDHYFAEIKKEYHKDIWTQEELNIHKYRQDDISKDQYISALKEIFNIDFIQQLNQEHITNFKTVMQETTTNFTTLSQNLQETSRELRESLQAMNTSTNAITAQNNINKTLVDFTVATRSFDKTSKAFSEQLNDSLNHTFDRIDTEVGEIVIQLADFAAHVSLESKEVQESISKYHRMVADHVKLR